MHVDSGPEETTEAAEQPGKHVQCKRMKGRHFDKRVKSELALEKELPGILNRDVPITVSALGMWIVNLFTCHSQTAEDRILPNIYLVYGYY